jgi:hypothetical protein
LVTDHLCELDFEHEAGFLFREALLHHEAYKLGIIATVSYSRGYLTIKEHEFANCDEQGRALLDDLGRDRNFGVHGNSLFSYA